MVLFINIFQGTDTKVLIGFIATLIALLISLGGIVWRLAVKITKLEAKIDTTDDKIDKVGNDLEKKISSMGNGIEKDVNRLIALVELKISHRQEVDAGMLTRMDRLELGIREIEKGLWKRRDTPV